MRFMGSILFAMGLFMSNMAVAATTATDKVVERFMELDADASASVSLAEYKRMVLRRMATRFAKMDANADGRVSEPEYRQFWIKQKSKYYRPRR